MVDHVETHNLDDEHPFSLEISSLKAAVSHFQDEAYNSSVKLQRFYLDTSALNDRLVQVERQNEILRQEVTILRANPHPDSSPQSHPAVMQSQQLTLSLRRLSDKLSLTEDTLLERTTELAHAHNEISKLRASLEALSVLSQQERDREEHMNARERELEQRIWELKEEAKMSDLVVNEYADLVRSLEGRSSTNKPHSEANGNSHSSLAGSLSEGKLGLHKLFAEFSEETEKLREEIHRLQNELVVSQEQNEAEKQAAAADRVALARCQHELDVLKNEDRSAAQMVSRYMKFSQSSTNALQESLSTLKTRHAATIDTLSAQLSVLTTQLHTSQTALDKLRFNCDELGRDILRESFGRRREIALRLRLVDREEIMFEGLGRWVRRAQEALDRAQNEQVDALGAMLADARALLTVLDGPQHGIGSSARIIAAETAVKTLNEELHRQTSRRMELESLVAPKESPQGDYEKQNHSLKRENVRLAVTTGSVQEAGVTDDAAATQVEARIEVYHEKEPQPLQIESDTQSSQSESAPTLRPDEAESNPPLITGISSVTNSELDNHASAFEPVLAKDPEVLVSPSDPDGHLVPESLSVTNSSPSAFFLSVETPDKQDEAPSTSETLRHPLLEELSKVGRRYDDIQRAFRDCHLALQDLKQSTLPPSNQDESSSYTINGYPAQLFQTAVERLDDFTEDARVELEIQIADEALRVQGFETMLSISDVFVQTSVSNMIHSDSTPSMLELESQINAFISGSDPSVQKAQQGLSRKLVDIQNDIAILKRALHDPDLSLTVPTPTTPTGSSAGGWTSWIRSPPSRPISPAPAPTFGDVMTTPRLRHASSFHNGLGHGRKPSTPAEGSVSTSTSGDAFASLGLKVATPTLRPSVSAPGGLVQRGPRTRTISTMYMLGLGSSRSSSASFGSSAPSNTASPQRRPSTSGTQDVQKEGEGDDEDTSDVE